MKKALKIILTLITASILSYWGYTWHKNTSSLLGNIHKDADGVLKIAIHDIKRTLVFDALRNPTYYYKQITSQSSRKKKDSSLKKGIDDQPYALTFFSMPKIKNTLFTVLPVQDSTALTKQIERYASKKKIHINLDKENNIHWATFKHYGVVAWNGKKLVVAIGLNSAYKMYKNVFTDLLIHNKLIQSKDHKWIKTLSANTNHISYVNKHGLIGINFEEGKALLTGHLKTHLPQAYPKEISIAKIPNTFISFYYDGNFAIPEHTKDFITNWKDNAVCKKLNLNVATMAKKINGFVYLGVNGNTVQTDTVVSYTFDDNFNKIAQKTLQEKEVPKIEIQLGGNKQHITSYFREQGVLTPEAIFSGIPYYQFYVKDTDAFTTFKTENTITNYKSTTSSSFMELSIDFAETKSNLNFTQLTPYFSLFKTLQISANQEENNSISLQGHLSGNLDDVNLLSQLFFGIKNNTITAP